MKRAAVTSLALLVTVLLCDPASAGPVHFVVAEPPALKHNNDSFVLALEDPLDIAHARDLIARGPEAAGASIVFAEIASGADGVNRDVLAAGEPLWNWHITKFEGFGDAGLELVDGWPSFVEEDVAGWIANTRRDHENPDDPGHIGFWNYTVLSEIGADSSPPPAVPLPAAVYVGGVMLCGVICGQIFSRVCRSRWS